MRKYVSAERRFLYMKNGVPDSFNPEAGKGPETNEAPDKSTEGRNDLMRELDTKLQRAEEKITQYSLRIQDLRNEGYNNTGRYEQMRTQMITAAVDLRIKIREVKKATNMQAIVQMRDEIEQAIPELARKFDDAITSLNQEIERDKADEMAFLEGAQAADTSVQRQPTGQATEPGSVSVEQDPTVSAAELRPATDVDFTESVGEEAEEFVSVGTEENFDPQPPRTETGRAPTEVERTARLAQGRQNRDVIVAQLKQLFFNNDWLWGHDNWEAEGKTVTDLIGLAQMHVDSAAASNAAAYNPNNKYVAKAGRSRAQGLRSAMSVIKRDFSAVQRAYGDLPELKLD